MVTTAGPAFAAPQAKVENCGWLVSKENALVLQPDASLKPSDPAPLPKPPLQAKAAYCDRDTLMSYVHDGRSGAEPQTKAAIVDAVLSGEALQGECEIFSFVGEDGRKRYQAVAQRR